MSVLLALVLAGSLVCTVGRCARGASVNAQQTAPMVTVAPNVAPGETASSEPESYTAPPPPPPLPELGDRPGADLPGPHAVRIAEDIWVLPELLGDHELLFERDEEHGTKLWIYDLRTARTREWQPVWDPAALGWPADSRLQLRQFTGSGNGRTIALSAQVDLPSATGAQMGGYCVLLLCDAATGHIRQLAIVQCTDGGPGLTQSFDGRLLYGMWIDWYEPTAAGWREWHRRVRAGEASGGMQSFPVHNVWDLEAETSLSAGVVDGELVTGNPWSDAVAPYGNVHVALGRLGAAGSRATAPGGPDWEYEFLEWVSPDLAKVWVTGAPGLELVDMQGRRLPLRKELAEARTLWWLADGRSLFIRSPDGPVELGRVDWRAGTVLEAEPCPALRHFEHTVQWRPLRDGASAVVLYGNGFRAGGSDAYFVRLDD
jgi:hypothetical protein